MEFVYKVDKDGLTGTITYKLPTAIERFKIAKECMYHVVDGELKILPEVDQGIKLIEIAKNYVTKVECMAGDLSITEFDVLSMDLRGSDVIMEIGRNLIGGSLLGKH